MVRRQRPAYPFGREDVAAEVELRGAGEDAGSEWVDILTGRPDGRAVRGRLKVGVPALTGTTLVRTKGR